MNFLGILRLLWVIFNWITHKLCQLVYVWIVFKQYFDFIMNSLNMLGNEIRFGLLWYNFVLLFGNGHSLNYFSTSFNYVSIHKH